MDPQQTPTTNPQPVAPPPAPAPPANAAGLAWERYVGHIVRWEDGTSWFVLRDGRHWIPDGDSYARLTAAKAEVFNLQAAELDAIPDIKGSHISLTGN